MPLSSYKRNLNEVEKTQKEISRKVITRDVLGKQIRKICGIDVSYKENIAFCSAVILDYNTLEEIEHVDYSLKTENDYISGYFMLREAKPILETLKKLNINYDILLIDGHGILHPRRCGLACYIGVILQKPTIGVAKKLLCGKLRKDSKVELDGEILGDSIEIKNKRIFISIGNMITLKTASKIIKKLILAEERYPEPLYLADKYARKFMRSIS